jgi:GNAT superfamily N-acetyltransferase
MRRRELAAHLQRTEAVEVGSYMRASPELARGMGTATKTIGGVVCMATKNVPEPFLNRALGVGTIAEATPRLLDRIERHYAAIGLPTRIALATGHVTKTTVNLLERRGYRPGGEGELIYVYDRRTPPEMPKLDGLTIDRAGPEIATLYSQTGFESFNDRGPEFVAIVEAIIRARRPGIRAFLARIDGEAAGTGMLFDVKPIGGLGNGSVRPKFRGRGLQKALIAHRIRDGWSRGYRIFFGQTVNPLSAHNMEDLGWRKLYDEVTWERA